ncbi:NADP-dependent oxidoreductase domain-containing protein [Dactylonectria estremocensis]|uniref:NADP-dependent oxidoreductase domain-containing protein n=1 Tax=Dactylonectria estremocensis TaxID=1079267 RepID=A0A9P9F7J9_9HYPO|nr:NADP-dependent oxidoreductase domain-containing protein [Dactylonectria estremocensis]
MSQACRLAKDLTLKGSATTIPKLVYGTAWKKDRSADLVYEALKNGFRGIDTAAQPKHYNEKGVAQGVRNAVRDGIIARETLFIQTKFSPPSAQGENSPYDLDAPLADKVHQSVRSSLDYFTTQGQEPYLDSVVMHSPMDTIEDTIAVWKTLETYVPGKIRNLGISNTTLAVLQALNNAATVKPSVVQNRFYAETGFEVGLRAYCREQGIVFQSFWTFSANPRLAQARPVGEVAEKSGVAPVAAYYALVLGLEGITILDGTTKVAHMKDDLEGIDAVGAWAGGDGAADWASALADFKELIGEI